MAIIQDDDPKTEENNKNKDKMIKINAYISQENKDLFENYCKKYFDDTISTGVKLLILKALDEKNLLK